jgi:hypothetical protein
MKKSITSDNSPWKYDITCIGRQTAMKGKLRRPAAIQPANPEIVPAPHRPSLYSYMDMIRWKRQG